MKTQNLMLVVETHSSGETTKVVMSGFPELKGNSMWEKTKFCQDRFDDLRKTLMSQPRGFSGILGAIVTEPVNKEADFGLVFIYSGGYFHSCGDSTFSVTKALLEQGMVQVEEPITKVVYDTAAGIVKAEAEVKNGVVGKISFDAPTAFYQESTVIDVPDIGKIHADIASGGLYYAIVDAEEVGVKVQPDNARKLTTIGMKILNAANAQVKVRHPEKPDLNKLELVTFSAKPEKSGHHFKHANVYSDTICVSPAGTSVGAKLATLVAKGKLRVGEEMIVESLVHPDLVMIGKATNKTKFGDYVAVTPRLSASAYITGTQQCIIEAGDPINHGFALS